jgi:hypothetical protein
MRSTVAVGAIFILLSGVSSWAADGVTGKWAIVVETGSAISGKQTLNSGPPKIRVLDLQAHGGTLNGTVTEPPDGPRKAPVTKTITHGIVDGNHVRFDEPTELGGYALATHYDGVVDGDTIHFTIRTGGGFSQKDLAPTTDAHRMQAAEETPEAASVANQGSPIAMTLDSGLKLATLTHADIERLAGTETRLDLFFLKYDPLLFDDPRIMRYFIVLNNCGSRMSVEQAFNSEFDYPKMTAFYRTNAPQILDDVPRTFSIRVSAFPNISHNRIISPIAAVLGNYDVARKAFPFVNGYNSDLKETIGLDNISVPGDRASDCLPAARILPNSMGLSGGSDYLIVFKPFEFTELPIDEAAAEAYVRRAGVGMGGRREVSLILDLELKPEAPQTVTNEKGQKLPAFVADIKKITVVDKSGWPIGTLNP